MRRLAFFVAVFMTALACAAAPAQAQQCKGTLYLTLDTGNMRDAQMYAQVLAKHKVKATFFLANELSWPDRSSAALEPLWADYWRARAAEGHAFGSHTWRHGLFSKDVGPTSVAYRPQFGEQAGKNLVLDAADICKEIKRVDQTFTQMTGKPLDPIWRAPGGRTTAATIAAAQACGYKHVHWAQAGFLGDELPSEKYPNALLLQRALSGLRDGDIMMGHLGIWSRKEHFAPVLEPLIVGLQERGFCFATLREHPQFKRP
jgi:peptidoglycan/xylan/chitin deacetylase (PgdA/CDA1 family)